ncbi:hypothetical protein PV08_06367 [Exophiala spinifera]|uniref:F-box domain-containing protein n=1 Tax=Exophiala spinifera TaxID=91928 RepID=A0A0D1YMP3_9EURO|nr:uncharacterized protein PV08_06367 [Exophiala spinifera]KIW16316.1 hypothetical protein PV08_06367 [Exophiala spinifera]
MASYAVFKIPDEIIESALVKVSGPRCNDGRFIKRDMHKNLVIGEHKSIFGDSVPRKDTNRDTTMETETDTQIESYIPAKIETIDHDLLLQIWKHLDEPSRVCLSLTNKFFGTFCMTPEVSGPVPMSNSTQLERVPDPTVLIGYSRDEKHTYCSKRRITLLLLRSWMPSDLQLCWACMKYTPLTQTEANASFFKAWNQGATATMIITMLDESEFHADLHCHDACLPRIRETLPMPFNVFCRHLPGGHAVHYNFGIDLREVVYLGSEVFDWGLVLPHLNYLLRDRRLKFEAALQQNIGSPMGLWKK